MKIKTTSKRSAFTIFELYLILFFLGVIALCVFFGMHAYNTGKKDLGVFSTLSVEKRLEKAEAQLAEFKESIAKGEREAIKTLHRFNDEDALRDKVSIYSGSEKQRIYLLNVPFYTQSNRDSIGAEPDFTIGNALAAFARRIEGKEEIVSTVPFPTTHRETPHTQGVFIITKVITSPPAEKLGQ